MRKLLTMAVGVVVALAVAAPGAVASVPLGDDDSDSWRVASPTLYGAAACGDWAGPCEFESESFDWEWAYSGPGWSLIDYCYSSSIEGEFLGDGTLRVTDAVIGSGLPTRMCERTYADALAWEGEVCEHVSTGEIWVRQGISLNTMPTGATLSHGVTFGEFVDSGWGDETMHLEFADAETGLWASFGFDYDHSADIYLETDGVELAGGVVGPPADPGSCGWPELS